MGGQNPPQGLSNLAQRVCHNQGLPSRPFYHDLQAKIPPRSRRKLLPSQGHRSFHLRPRSCYGHQTWRQMLVEAPNNRHIWQDKLKKGMFGNFTCQTFQTCGSSHIWKLQDSATKINPTGPAGTMTASPMGKLNPEVSLLACHRLETKGSSC